METEIQITNTESEISAPEASSQASSTPDTSTEVQSSSAEPSASGEPTGPTVNGQPIQNAWKPNFKFKVKDEEFEIDPEYQAYIKSQDDEKRIKRMFEQIKGVDKLKNQYESTKNEYSTTKTELEGYKNGFQTFNTLVQKGQFKKAFDLFQIPKEVMYKAAMQYLEFDEMPPQHQEAYSKLTEQERTNAYLQQQNQQMVQQFNEIRTQQLSHELTTVLSRADVKSVSEKYDQANGPGSFKALVKQKGLSHYALHGQDISATQAVEEILAMVKPFMASQAPQMPSVPTGAPKEVPVIPATGGSSASAPGAPKIKSIKDLKKLAEKYSD